MLLRLIDTECAEYDQMKELRLRVLLEPIGVPSSYINPEKEKNDLLICAFESNELVGCCILTKVNKDTLQLRQMAVDTKMQGTGVGASIIDFAETTAKESGYQKLMMHARDAVIPFYEKCGYNISGEQFFEVGIPHHRMEKELVRLPFF